MEKRQFDVTALGELLIDFTEKRFQFPGQPSYGSQSWWSPM